MSATEFAGLTERLTAELHKQSELCDQLIILITAYQESILEMVKQVNDD